ncbi:MAG: carbohydrate ABC transporter permease [Chloroflexi bacterium]|nr:carbohydrate ABC transporter permease [Chloroflexota bacterium]
MQSSSIPTQPVATRQSALSLHNVLGWLRNRFATRIFLWLLLLFFLLPIVWTVSSSFKNREDLFQGTPSLITLRPTLANYVYALQKFRDFDTYYRNSIIVTGGAVAVQTVLATLAGYGFARVRFKGRDLIFYTMILLIFVPRAGGLMAQYELMNFLHLRNSLIGLILALSAGLAVPCFIMRQAFLNMPVDYEDAAQIDGANRFQAFWHIMLPMATGAAAVVAMFEFIRVWGEYLFTLTMIDDRELFTLGVGMAMTLLGVTMEFGEFTSYGAQAAIYIMAAAPVVVFFLAVQRWFVRGLMEGLKF